MQYSEKDIEDILVDEIDIIDGDLNVIGRQIDLGGYGILDILAFDSVAEQYVVIELKSEVATEKTITQIMRYMMGVRDFLEDNEREYPVVGMIVAPKIEDEAKSALRFVQDQITFYELKINLEVESCNYVRAKEHQGYKQGNVKFLKIIDDFKPEEHVIEPVPEPEPREGD